jgi:hypothetical protein
MMTDLSWISLKQMNNMTYDPNIEERETTITLQVPTAKIA